MAKIRFKLLIFYLQCAIIMHNKYTKLINETKIKCFLLSMCIKIAQNANKCNIL